MTRMKNYGARVLGLINEYLKEHNVQLECTFEEIVEQVSEWLGPILGLV